MPTVYIVFFHPFFFPSSPPLFPTLYLSPASHSCFINFFFSLTLCRGVRIFKNSHSRVAPPQWRPRASHRAPISSRQRTGTICAPACGHTEWPFSGCTFPRSHITAIVRYKAASVWLLFLSTMHLRFICVAESVNSLLPFSAEQTLFNDMDLLQFVYPFTNWRAFGLPPVWGNNE